MKALGLTRGVYVLEHEGVVRRIHGCFYAAAVLNGKYI